MTTEKYIRNLEMYNWEVPKEMLNEFQPVRNPTIKVLRFNSFNGTYNVSFKDREHDYIFRVKTMSKNKK